MVVDTRSFRLNLSQKQAVAHMGSPLLLVAGAGTGKTTVLVERIRTLFEKQHVLPRQILAVTFTEKAAAEMLERTDVVLPLGYEEPWITTFHGFCERVLRQEALVLGLNPDYDILTPAKQWLLIRAHLFEFPLVQFRPLGNPTKFISALLTFFSRAKDEVISPDDFVQYVNKRRKNAQRLKHNDPAELETFTQLLELGAAYAFYEKLMVAESKLDFGDLILKTIQLFQKHPSVLKRYQNQFKHILVDEFQDTNIAQYELIKILTTAQTGLMVVGDDDQAIYRFRGAAVSNILMFKKDFPKSKTIVLTQNYRSGQKMLDMAHGLIRFNDPDRLESKEGIDKTLKAKRGLLHKPQIIHAQTGEEEAEQVTMQIINHLKLGKYTYKDFAILARANNHLESFAAALKRHGLPYHVAGNRGLYDQEEIQLLTAYLRVLADPDLDLYVYRLLSSFLFSLPSADLAKILAAAKKSNQSIFETLKKQIPNLSTDSRAIIDGFKNRLNEDQRELTQKTALQILYDFVIKSGFIQYFTQVETLQSQLQLRNVNLFFEQIKAFEKDAEDLSVFGLVDYLDLLLEAGENPAQAELEDIDVINLMTVHSAKGLEFGVVFLVNLVSQRFPSRERADALELPEALIKEIKPSGDAHLQEERRLFYVGMTRSRDYLYFSYANQYGLGKSKKRASQFVKESGVVGELSLSTMALAGESKPTLPQTLDRPLVLADVRPPLKQFSYSHLDTFLSCPLKFKYKHILQVPVPSGHAQSFGLSLHRILRDFTLAFMKRQKLGSKQELVKLLEKHWIASGYLNKKHEQEALATAKRMLGDYLKYNRRNFKGVPKYLEHKFYLKIGRYPIVGYIDRIDQLPDGSFEVIDYKTGSPKDQNAVDRDAQLTIYALACEDALKLKVSKLSLYFLDSHEKVTTTRSAEKLNKERAKIEEQIEKIMQSDFTPTPSDFVCSYCEYKSICPAYKLPVK